MSMNSLNRRSIAIAILLIFFIDAFASALYIGSKIALEDGLRTSMVNTAKSAAKLFDIAGVSGTEAIMQSDSVKEIFILDSDDDIIFSTDHGALLHQPRRILRVDENEIESARNGVAAAGVPYKAESEYYLRGFAPLGSGVVLGVSAATPSFAALDMLSRIFWSWIFLSVLLAVLIVLFYRRAVKEVEVERIRAERGERFEALSRMAASVAHEIRNPLNIISATLELRDRELNKSCDESNMIIDLREEVDRLERVVQDFLDLSKNLNLRYSKFEANEVVELTVYREELRLKTKPEGIPAIRCILDKDAGALVADKDRVVQMLTNILRNASEACSDKAPCGEIEFKTEGRQNEVIFIIDDSGEGILEIDREAIFEPFLTKKRRGSGLGLAVVKSIADAHGGSVEVDNSHLGGARFTIRIPRNNSLEFDK